ncbi:hypothetical protein [Chryseobacterium sp.]|uniref:hypothetical protein n=1 Tax=Chryseobacterium sp. TaxID=1871047 RepID=UPI0035C784FB
MKKIFSVLALTVFAFSFSQTYVNVSSVKNQVENVYKGGQEKFEYDLTNNLRYTANAFQANGDFTLNFKLNENGDITDVKLLPELYDKGFEREVKRDLGRMKKHFAVNKPKNVSVGLSFGRDLKPSDGRLAFQGRDSFANQNTK